MNWFKRLDSLKEVTKLSCADGTYNYDPYFHGMANGLILAVNIMEDSKNMNGPNFKSAPTRWLKDVNAVTYSTAWFIKIAYITKKQDGYYVMSEKGKHLGGPYSSKTQAKKRLQQVEFWKRKK